MSERGDTATRILDVAQELAQTRGYNAFSYADIAEQVGIRTASIHYYFPSKSDLGRALIDRYQRTAEGVFAQIDTATDDPRQKLRRYSEMFLHFMLHGERMCLGGILAADILTLPSEIRDEVQSFFDLNEHWLTRILGEGRRAGLLQFTGAPEVEARLLVASLEGALLVARSYGDVERYRELADKVLADREAPMAE
jgi:TetR/AcrR family transcriptional repressor of nem operon